MEGPGLPDILAFKIAEAVKILEQYNMSAHVVHTSPHGKPGHGAVRVVRQRVLGEKTVELTVTAEDWGKEV